MLPDPRALTLLLASAACMPENETDTEPPPPPLTARLTADATLRFCTWSGEEWLGVRQLAVTLEHRLDPLTRRELPAPGTCVDGLSLYAEESLPTGDPLDEVAGNPRWRGPAGGGVIDDLGPGLWHQPIYSAPERCGDLDETLGGGIALEASGDLSGLITPAAGTVSTVTADGQQLVDHPPVEVGDPVSLTWEAQGWDGAFVQIRRSREGETEPRQVLTCTPDAEGAYTVGDAAWSLVNPAILAEDTTVRLGLWRRELVQVESGASRALVLSRVAVDLAP